MKRDNGPLIPPESRKIDRCDGCKLQSSRFRHPVCIPSFSKQIDGCIISRDPTYKFLEVLDKLEDNRSEYSGNFCFNAPPKWLYQRIEYFMDSSLPSSEIEKLTDFLNFRCYWTHLHKCATKKKTENRNGLISETEYPPFAYQTAEYCANAWMKSEFEKHRLRDKIIITLGRDVEKYFKQGHGKSLLTRNDSLICLPHPSRANCGSIWSWNKKCRESESISGEIKNLISRI